MHRNKSIYPGLMRKQICLIISILAVAVGSATIQEIKVNSQYIPVPNRYPGLTIGEQSAPITIELVYDPTCDGSAEFDQTIRKFYSDLDVATKSKVKLNFAINVLPYHIASFKLAEAVRYVYDHSGSQEALSVLRYFLDDISSWDEASLRKITIANRMENIAIKVASLTGLNKDDIRKELAHYSTTDGRTRGWAKYVMGSLRIPGTPFMLVNGVRVDGGTNMSASQLTTYIKKLL